MFANLLVKEFLLGVFKIQYDLNNQSVKGFSFLLRNVVIKKMISKVEITCGDTM